MERKKIMQTIIELNNFFIDEWNKRGSHQMTKDPHLTNDWLETKFDRFYLVESTKHNEENFTIEVELRYALRSKESNLYGFEHNAFIKRYLSTISIEMQYIDNPQAYKDMIIDEMKNIS